MSQSSLSLPFLLALPSELFECEVLPRLDAPSLLALALSCRRLRSHLFLHGDDGSDTLTKIDMKAPLWKRLHEDKAERSPLEALFFKCLENDYSHLFLEVPPPCLPPYSFSIS